MSTRTEETDFSERQNSPFMVGVYLAVNAIRDAFLLVDGPDCAHMKTQYVQGNHDWLSTLTDISGFHRVANTAAHPFTMAPGREPAIQATLERMAEHERSGLVLVTSLPMAAITGVDYDRIARAAAGSGSTPVLQIPGRSLSGDWLSGYAATLQSLAAGLELDASRRRESAVACVGYLHDRNEGDHEANLAELRRLLAGLGLDLCSTWLGGGPAAELERVSEASLIVSLPYGRRAARTLARRLDVPLVETDLPFGLDGTTRWIRAVADAAGRSDEVEALVDGELLRVAPKLQWVVPAVFLHRTVSFVGDPHLLDGFLDFTSELGFRHGPMVVTARIGHRPSLEERAEELGVVFEPKRRLLDAHLSEPVHAGKVDLLVTNSTCASFLAGRTPVVEFGYPSYFTHSLYQRPFLGYDGALAFADRMANALRRIDLLRRPEGRPPAPADDA